MQNDNDFYTAVWKRSIKRAAKAEIKSDLITFIEHYAVDENSNLYDGSKSSLEIEYIESQRNFLNELKPILIDCIKNHF